MAREKTTEGVCAMIESIVIFGAIAVFLGELAYVRDTYLGRSAPNRITFFLWALAPFIATAAEVSEGVTWAALPVFMVGFGPFMVLLASFTNKKAVWKLGKFDWACGVLAVLALALWAITQDALVAIVFALLSDALAGFPTLKKSWTHPETETIWAYVGSTIAVITGLIAAKTTNFSEIGFLLYILLFDLTVVLMLFFRGRYKKKQLAQAEAT